MGTLTDRQYGSHRTVRPGRRNLDRYGERGNLEQDALAVSGPDGGSVLEDLPSLLRELLLEQRRTNVLLQLLVDEEVNLSDVA